MAGTTSRYRGDPVLEAENPAAPGPAARPVLSSGQVDGDAIADFAGRFAAPPAAASGAGTQALGPAPRIQFRDRRFLVPGECLPAVTRYTVQAGDRIDLIAARLLGSPFLYWMIADANDAMDPGRLCRPGATLRIPAPTAEIDANAARALSFAGGDPETPGSSG